MGQQHSSHHPNNSNNTDTSPYSNVVQNGEPRSQHPIPRRVHRILSVSESHLSAKDSRSNLRTPQDPPPRYRQTPEIAYVLRVAKYLDPVSRMSLKYTDRYLYRGLEYTIASELQCPKPRPIASLQIRDSIPVEAASQERAIVDPARERRLLLLKLLVEDGLYGDGKSICAPCLSVHEDSLFLPGELEKSDRERRCLGFTGKVWLCPHLQLDYDQVVRYDPRPPPSTPMPGYSHCRIQPPNSLTCFDCTSIQASFTTTTTILPRTSHTTTTTTVLPLYHLPPSRPYLPPTREDGFAPRYVRSVPHALPSQADVSGILKRINAPLCPHVRTSDDCVGAAYERSCEVLARMGVVRQDRDRETLPVDCRCKACSGGGGRTGGGACGVCGVRWGFDGKGCWAHWLRGEGSDWVRFLRLRVEREIRVGVGGRGVLDEKWRKGLVQPDVEGEVQIKRKWEVAVGVCKGLMHVDATDKHRKECKGCFYGPLLGS